MNLTRCDFCGRIFKASYLNKLELYGPAMEDVLELKTDVCNDCAKDIYKIINQTEYKRK